MPVLEDLQAGTHQPGGQRGGMKFIAEPGGKQAGS